MMMPRVLPLTPSKDITIVAVFQNDEEDRFKWDPSNARWVRVKPGKDETGADEDQPIASSVSISQAIYVAFPGKVHSLKYPEVDLFSLPGKYTTDNWEKGGGATITPLSGSPYVVRNASHVAGMCTSNHVDMLHNQSLSFKGAHLILHYLYTPTP